MDKMKAYVFKDVGNLVFEEKPIPHVKDPDDVLLKVKAVGICGSDIKIIEGKHHFRPNTVLGHEFCGEVVEIGTHVHHVQDRRPGGDRQQHPLRILLVLPHGPDQPVRRDQDQRPGRDARRRLCRVLPGPREAVLPAARRHR